MDWQPIDTAPKDGSLVDLLELSSNGKAERVIDAQWNYQKDSGELYGDRGGHAWRADGYVYDVFGSWPVRINPTHWMRPPAPPNPTPSTKAS